MRKLCTSKRRLDASGVRYSGSSTLHVASGSGFRWFRVESSIPHWASSFFFCLRASAFIRSCSFSSCFTRRSSSCRSHSSCCLSRSSSRRFLRSSGSAPSATSRSFSPCSFFLYSWYSSFASFTIRISSRSQVDPRSATNW